MKFDIYLACRSGKMLEKIHQLIGKEIPLGAKSIQVYRLQSRPLQKLNGRFAPIMDKSSVSFKICR